MTRPGTDAGKTTTMETIYVGGAIFVRLDGRWQRSPLTTQDYRDVRPPEGVR